MSKISVIIANRNCARHLPKCLDSVLGQSLRDFETIVVDDASTDGSKEVISRYAAKDGRIRPILLDENVGAGGARNLAIDKAQGDYVFIADADDCLPNAEVFKSLYDYCQSAKADVVEFDFNMYDESGAILYRSSLAQFLVKGKWDLASRKRPSPTPCAPDDDPDSQAVRPETQGLLTRLAKLRSAAARGLPRDQYAFAFSDIQGRFKHYPFVTWNKMYSRDFLRRHGVKFGEGNHGEDHLFTFMTLLEAPRIFYYPKVCYSYIQHQSSLTNRLSAKNIVVFDNLGAIEKYIASRPDFGALRKTWLEYQANTLKIHYFAMPPADRQLFIATARQRLPEAAFAQFQRRTSLSIKEKILSLKNSKCCDEDGKILKKKVLTVLGMSFVLKTTKM